MGGDLNVRSGMNGDGVVNTAGRALLRLAGRHSITFVNAMDLAKGLFSRQQWVELHKGTPERVQALSSGGTPEEVAQCGQLALFVNRLLEERQVYTSCYSWRWVFAISSHRRAWLTRE